jgi:hypothetical protein
MADVKPRTEKRKSYDTYAGRNKRTRIDGQFCPHLIDMLRAPRLVRAQPVSTPHPRPH